MFRYKLRRGFLDLRGNVTGDWTVRDLRFDILTVVKLSKFVLGAVDKGSMFLQNFGTYL
jgi:hypothetical protein